MGVGTAAQRALVTVGTTEVRSRKEDLCNGVLVKLGQRLQPRGQVGMQWWEAGAVNWETCSKEGEKRLNGKKFWIDSQELGATRWWKDGELGREVKGWCSGPYLGKLKTVMPLIANGKEKVEQLGVGSCLGMLGLKFWKQSEVSGGYMEFTNSSELKLSSGKHLSARNSWRCDHTIPSSKKRPSTPIMPQGLWKAKTISPLDCNLLREEPQYLSPHFSPHHHQQALAPRGKAPTWLVSLSRQEEAQEIERTAHTDM